MTNVATFAEHCPGCFNGKGNTSICPHCCYDESLKRGPLFLPHRTLLHHRQYLIGKVLGKPGGFGITYLALDTKLETKVAIKEYLPRDLAGRDAGHATISAHSEEDGEFFRYGLTQFLQEVRTLAQFDHANIVRVRNFFEENGTGYLVMDYYDGITLADYLAQQPQGRLPEETAVGILMPILDGLREVHAKHFLHRDIKPQNIYLTTANRPILLDFGAARQAMGERSRSLSVVLSEGYAPYEQYHRRGEQGPWTDIYACAAVLYHAVAGEAPPPATERMHKDELDIAALGLSASLTEALRLGLATDHHNRPQGMTEFQALLLVGMGSTRVEDGEQKPKMTALSAPAEVLESGRIEPTFYQITSPNLPEMAPPQRMPNLSKGRRGLQAWWAPTLVVVIVIALVAIATKVEKSTLPTVDTSKPIAGEKAARLAEVKNADTDQQAATEVDRQQQLNNEVAAETAKQEAQRKTAIDETEPRAKAEQQSSAKLVKEPIAIWNRAFTFFVEGGRETEGKRIIQEGIELLRRMDPVSVGLIRKMADRGGAAEQTILGFMYGQGAGITKNPIESVRWYRKAADQGYATAQVALSMNYGSGDGISKDEAEAFRWLRKAAENEHVSAQMSVGVSYLRGAGVTKDEAEGLRWVRKAANQGNTFALKILGESYAKGQYGVSKDWIEAIRWFRKAAEQGDPNAQYVLGLAYANGEGVTKDLIEAIRWVRKAAEQGDAKAQYTLGIAYANGEGLTGDLIEAVRWFRKAAEQGDAKGQHALGVAYANGEGVTKDNAMAVLWFRKAAEHGLPESKVALKAIEK